MMNTYKTITVFALTVLFSSAASAATSYGNSIQDKHSFRLGIYSQDAEITAQSTVDPFPPIEISLTDDLNMDDNSEAIYFNYRWRFLEKWTLSATFERLELDGNGAAGFNFNFDGKPFMAGATVESEFNTDTYLIDVAYSFIRNDRWELLLGAGIHAFDIETSIVGTVFLEGGGLEPILQRSDANADVLAPLPNLRAGTTFMINPRWEVNAGVGWLSLEIDNVDGKYTYLDIGTEYRITERFGIGATYQLSKIDVTSTDSDGIDKFDIEFSGPSIYISYGF